MLTAKYAAMLSDLINRAASIADRKVLLTTEPPDHNRKWAENMGYTHFVIVGACIEGGTSFEEATHKFVMRYLSEGIRQHNSRFNPDPQTRLLLGFTFDEELKSTRVQER